MSYINNTPFSSKLIFLDSRNATKHDNEYTFNFSTDIECPHYAKMVVSIREINIPNIFPNVISNINDSIEITGTLTGITTYTFPQTYYSVKTFKSTFDALSISLGKDIICTYDTETLKLTFTSATEDFTITNNTTMKLIGFNTSITSTSCSLTVPYTMNFSSEPYIFLKSSLVLRNINNLGETSNTFMRVPIGSVPYGFNLYHEPQQPIEYLSHDQFLRQIKFQLKSNQGLIVNLDNHSFQVVIQISYIYPEKVKLYENPFELNGSHKHPLDMSEQEREMILKKKEDNKLNNEN